MKRALRAIAAAVCILFASSVAAQAPSAIVAQLPPVRLVTTEAVPSVYRSVVWEQRDASGALLDSHRGYWYTVEQIARVSTRIDYLETRAAKECTDATIEGVRHNVPWLWLGLGVVAGGVGGYFLGKKLL